MKPTKIQVGFFGTGTDDGPVMITEYEQKARTWKNPNFIILERGYTDLDGDVKTEGGCITLMIGCDITESEVELV